jgi:hypothetical protein
MSKEVSIFKNQSQVIASDGRRSSALGKKLADSIKLYSRRIQTNNKGFFRKIINGEQVGEPIRDSFNAIIVGMLPDVSRIYYAGKYDPEGEPTLPNCWSSNSSTPDAQSPDKQHTNCAECPKNVKGSGENGSRACRFQRRVAIVLEGDASGDVYQFSIPAKSLFGKGTGNVHPFESYVKYLLMNREAPDTVVTQISYDLDADGMELLFSPVRQLTDAEFNLVAAAQTRPETDMYTRITVAQTDGVTKKPAPAAVAAPAPRPKVQRTEDPEDEEAEEAEVVAAVIEEPIKRSTRKREAEPVEDVESEEDKLASVISEWGRKS